MGGKKAAQQRVVQITVPELVYREIQKQAKANSWTMQTLYAECVERFLAGLGREFIPFYATDKGDESKLLNLWLPQDLYRRARVAADKHRATQVSFFYTALLRFLFQQQGGHYQFEDRADKRPNSG